MLFFSFNNLIYCENNNNNNNNNNNSIKQIYMFII